MVCYTDIWPSNLVQKAFARAQRCHLFSPCCLPGRGKPASSIFPQSKLGIIVSGTKAGEVNLLPCTISLFREPIDRRHHRLLWTPLHRPRGGGKPFTRTPFGHQEYYNVPFFTLCLSRLALSENSLVVSLPPLPERGAGICRRGGGQYVVLDLPARPSPILSLALSLSKYTQSKKGNENVQTCPLLASCRSLMKIARVPACLPSGGPPVDEKNRQ